MLLSRLRDGSLADFGVILISSGLSFQGDPQSQDPVVYDNGVTYMFIQHSNVYLMVAARQNCNAASLLFFLHRVVDVRAIDKFLYVRTINFGSLRTYQHNVEEKKKFEVLVCNENCACVVAGIQALFRGTRGGIA